MFDGMWIDMGEPAVFELHVDIDGKRQLHFLWRMEIDHRRFQAHGDVGMASLGSLGWIRLNGAAPLNLVAEIGERLILGVDAGERQAGLVLE